MSIFETIKKPFAIAATTSALLYAPIASASEFEQKNQQAVEQVIQKPALSETVTKTINQINTILTQDLSVNERRILEKFQARASQINKISPNDSTKLSSIELQSLKNQVIILEAMIAQAELKAIKSSFSDWISIKYEGLSVKLKFYYKLAKTSISQSKIVISIKNYLETVLAKITK